MGVSILEHAFKAGQVLEKEGESPQVQSPHVKTDFWSVRNWGDYLAMRAEPG